MELTKVLSAEGTTFLTGTEMEIDGVYDDSSDLIDRETEILMWVCTEKIVKAGSAHRFV